MKKNTYSFRDSNNILENFDKGFRSKFIRESLERNIKHYNDVHYEKLDVYYELIEFYKQQDKKYSKELDDLNKSVKTLKELKEKNYIKLNEKISETKYLMNIINLNREIKENDDLESIREDVCRTIIRLILLNMGNETTEINMEYLKSKGKFLNIKEMKSYITGYVNEKLEEDTMIDKTLITKDDIHYIKKQINETII